MIPIFIVLFVLAAFFQADFVLAILYLLAGAYVFGHWWSRRAARSINISRNFNNRAFFGEIVPVEITVRNSGWLPVVWVHVRENLPAGLAADGLTQQVFYLGPKAFQKLSFQLDCQHRGYYAIGPTSLFSGDLLGIARQQMVTAPEDHLTVYPKIISLSQVTVPTHSPLGTLKHHQPIYEDPARVRGKRDYISGDSLRRIDWKATAVLQRLQVKHLEPSIALETMIFLNLNREEYAIKDLYRASELAIVAAASLANWLIRARQAVGLATNGADPRGQGEPPLAVFPRTGQPQLLRLLEILAGIQNEETFSLVKLIQQEAIRLSWGTTMIVIANQVKDDLFDTLFQARRRGLEAILVLCGFVEPVQEIKRKAAYFKFPTYHLLTEQDLDVWRG